MMLPTSSRSGKKTSKLGRAARQHLVQPVGGELDVGLDDHFAGVRIDHVGGGQRAVELGSFNFNFVDRRRRAAP